MGPAELVEGDELLAARVGDVLALVRSGSPWGYRAPLALTCNELFARVYERPASGQTGHFNVARVRLDALGTPSFVPDR